MHLVQEIFFQRTHQDTTQKKCGRDTLECETIATRVRGLSIQYLIQSYNISLKPYLENEFRLQDIKVWKNQFVK